MKKLLLAGAFALFGAVSMNAQAGFNLGANVGLPVGDMGDFSSFKLGLDANYLWSVGDGFNLGIGSGYQAWLGKDVNGFKVPTMSLIPIVAVGEYNVSDQFAIGADLGYGLVMWDGDNDGGFLYQPKVMYNLGESGSLWLGYQGVSMDGWNASAINLGYRFNLGGN